MSHISKERFITAKKLKVKNPGDTDKDDLEDTSYVCCHGISIEVWIKCTDCKLWAHELTAVPDLFA
jgi:hypothetical protein